jgi:hypothetical protein
MPSQLFFARFFCRLRADGEIKRFSATDMLALFGPRLTPFANAAAYSPGKPSKSPFIRQSGVVSG